MRPLPMPAEDDSNALTPVPSQERRQRRAQLGRTDLPNTRCLSRCRCCCCCCCYPHPARIGATKRNPWDRSYNVDSISLVKRAKIRVHVAFCRYSLGTLMYNPGPHHRPSTRPNADETTPSKQRRQAKTQGVNDLVSLQRGCYNRLGGGGPGSGGTAFS